MGRQREALDIYQRVLDTVSKALLESDAKQVALYLNLPFHMRTAKGWFPLNTLDDVEQMVSSMHLSLKIQGVTDYVRNATSAQFMGAGEIEGVHLTHIIKNQRPLITPYESRMKLKKFGDDWRVMTAEHSMDNAKWPIEMPKVSTGSLADLERDRKNDLDAMEIYQDFINKLTDANIAGDRDAWTELCEFPHTVKIDHITHTIDDPDDTSVFLNTMSSILNDAINEEFKREANFAGFLGKDIIRGYHTTTLGGATNSAFRPVQSRITIRRTNGVWRVIELVNSIANTEFPYEKPLVSDGLISEFHNPRKAQLQ